MQDQRASAPNNTTADYLVGLGQVQRFPRKDVELCVVKNFLTPDECQGLIERIDRDCHPSTIADPNGDSYFRTSDTCDLDHHDAFVRAIDHKLAAFSGIEWQYGEPLQGQRYNVGQEFKAHNDWFNPSGQDYEKYCAIAGQRSWTFMVYLNEPKAGGATRFVQLNKTFQPKRGMLVCWNNMDTNNHPSDLVMHHGMKVRSGTKYIITKWYRQKLWPWPEQLTNKQ
jgi:prolyl 4-hydroxylase